MQNRRDVEVVSEEHSSNRPDAWRKVHESPPLGEDDVHVWLVRVPPAREGELPLPDRPSRVPTLSSGGPPPLSSDELARARSFAEPARSRFVAARTALRERLADYLGCAACDVGFDYGDMGKPHLRSHERLHFSVAHAGDLALLAFARAAPVGVDIERLRTVARRERIARRVLAADSAEALMGVSPQERDEAFIWAWTQREAYVKAIGSGVLRSPDPLPFVWPPRAYGSAGWQVTPIPIVAGYHACLVVHGPLRTVELLRSF